LNLINHLLPHKGTMLRKLTFFRNLEKSQT
jgi:hypothetical protein